MNEMPRKKRGICFFEMQSKSQNMNGDGILDVLDVVSLINAVLSGSYSAPGDMNQDGVLDILDIVTLVNTILN